MPLIKNASAEAGTQNKNQKDLRPRFGIGHMVMHAADVEALTAFYGRVGMRVVVQSSNFAILELRGGTHLILQPGEPGQAVLDLIVDDIDDTRADLIAAGVDATGITRGHPHDRFTSADPEGNVLLISSNHAMGPV